MIPQREKTSNYYKTGEVTKRSNRLMQRYKKFGEKDTILKEQYEGIQNKLKEMKKNAKYEKLISYDRKNKMYKITSPLKNNAKQKENWNYLISITEGSLPYINIASLYV